MLACTDSACPLAQVGFGTGLVILSLVGLYSACSNDRHGLFLYYTGLMLLAGTLLYLGVYCLLFADNARRFELLYYQHRAPAGLPNSQQAGQERAMAKVGATPGHGWHRQHSFECDFHKALSGCAVDRLSLFPKVFADLFEPISRGCLAP